jgi:hypothetical protein
MPMKRVTVDGKTLNARTAKMLRRAEAILGENLYVLQGSYNAGGVSASAGTHDGGGALDVSPTSNPNRVVLALRKAGFAAWHRLPSQGPWTEHIHAIAIGDPEMSSGAATQVREYYSGQNGLATHLPDDGPRLDPIPEWPVKLPAVSLKSVQRQFQSDTPKKLNGVKRVQEVLNYRLGLAIPEDGVAGPVTRSAYKQWEQHLGVQDPDTLPGYTQLKKLFTGWYTLNK